MAVDKQKPVRVSPSAVDIHFFFRDVDRSAIRINEQRMDGFIEFMDKWSNTRAAGITRSRRFEKSNIRQAPSVLPFVVLP